MATNFPEELDSFTNPLSTDSVAAVSHAAQHANANDAIEALQAKVGVDGSSNTSSLDYRVTSLENASVDTESIQDIVAGVLNAGTHTNITVTYDDENNKINLAATYADEQVIDVIATALTAGNGISKAFDDELNTITISVDTSSIATQEYVNTAISSLVDSAPGLLDTLNEIAAAIGDDANFATTINNAIAAKQNSLTPGTGIQIVSDTISVINNTYDSYGSANTAEENAKDYADSLAINYDPAGSASTAEANANTYTDNAITALDTDDIEEGITNKYFTNQRALDATSTAYDILGAASQALSDAEDYVDNALLGYTPTISLDSTISGYGYLKSVDLAGYATESYADIVAANAQTAANTYTDTAIGNLDTDDIEEGTTNKYFTDQRALDATSTAYDPAGSAAQALSDANDYTDLAISGLGDTVENGYIPIGQKANPGGVASLGLDGYVPDNQLNINERIQDIAAGMITSATHTNISVSYDEDNNKLSFTGTSGLSQEEIQDFVAPLLNHSSHTNISASYDDDNNKIILSSSGGTSVTISANAPLSPSSGNIWLDSDNGKTYIWDGAYWIEVGASTGASVLISSTPPVTPGLGDIWLDSDNGRTYIWDGEFWAEVGVGQAQAVAAVTSTPPSSPVLGTIWLNSTTAKTYIYDGMYWVEV